MLFYILSSGIELTLWLGYKAVSGTYNLLWPTEKPITNSRLVKEIELLRCEVNQLRKNIEHQN